MSCQRAIPIAAAVLLALASGSVSAAGARRGVEAGHGEMTLLRDVHARPAYRPMPPGMAIIADPTPNRQLAGALGTGELSDEDFAALNAGAPVAGPAVGGGVGLAQRIEDPLQAALGGRASHGAGGAASAPGGAIGIPVGAVGNATRGLGDRIQGALAQFPLPGKPAEGP